MLPFLRTRAGVAFLVLLAAVLLMAGCGDVYRPVANPVLLPGGDPQQGSFAFVLSQGAGSAGSVSIVDVSGDTNLGNAPVGPGAVYGGLLPNTARMFVANRDNDTLSVVTSTSNTQRRPQTITMPTGSKPSFVASAGTTTVYVSTPGTVPPSVSVVDPLNDLFVNSIPVGNNPGAIVVSPNGSRVYVLNYDDGTVSVLVPGINSVTQTLAVGAQPIWAVMSADGTKAWVLNLGSNTVSVIDVTNGQVSATIAVGTAPRFAALDSHLNRLYVANAGSNSISVIDTTTETVMRTVSVGAAPVSLTPLADGSRIYVANSGCTDVVALQNCSGNTVSVVDAGSFTLRKTITVGSTPISLGSDLGATKVVVANRDSNNISAIRTSDDTVVNTLPSGAARPVWVAFTH